jgi:DMSO/TMAO reductase YedYZ molybdopterin-dependent catalytic subunit
MQVIKRHKIVASVALLLVIVFIGSIVAYVQNSPKQSSTQSATPTSSPFPTENSPTPTATLTATPTPIPTSTPNPTPQLTFTPYLFPNEVAQYQGQNLTAVSVYISYLNQHPDVAIAGAQFINTDTYRLAITGLVNNTLNLSYNTVVNNFNSTLQVAALPCVEGWSVTMLWQGVPISDILGQAGVGSGATTLIFVAADGYTTSLPLDYVRQNNIMVAYKMNNVTLTPQTGWPLFLVAKDQYGYKWIEWLTEINVSNDANYLGYWESRGYPNNATVT